MAIDVIRSRQNTQVKDLKRLAESKRARLAAGVVVSEGEHLLRAMLDAGIQPTLVAIAERLLPNPAIQNLLHECDTARCILIADDVFDQIAPTDSPSGLLTLSTLPAHSEPPQHNADTLVLEAVQDPGNVGSLIRTALAAGVQQIVLSTGCADPWSPRCLRAAQGAQWLAHIYADYDLDGFLQAFQGDIAATVPTGGSSLYAQTFNAPVAWLFGNEGQGLSVGLIARATRRLSIPMPGKVESLNVNAAAAVCLFEQTRQHNALM